MKKRILSALVIAAAIAASAAAFSPVKYEVKQKHVLGGEGGWDYLTFDPAGKRLFISRGTHVMVVDPAKGSVIGDIPDTTGVHGIALAQELGKGFTSNGRDNSVTVFDLKTLKTTNKIKIEAENPDAILYDSASQRVFTFNGRSKNATVIDAAKDAVVATIPLDGKPEFAAADGKGMVFVNIEDKSELTQIDAKDAKVVKSWPLAPCEEPSGLAIDQKHHRLFSGCGNKLMAVSDAETGKMITTVPIGEGVDANAFDPETQLAFSSNGRDGTLTVVHEDSPDKFTVLENAPTEKFARTMALNTTNHDVYLVTAEIEEQPPAKEGERPRRTMKPGTFTLLVVGSAAAAPAKAESPKSKKAEGAGTAAAAKDPATEALYKSKCQMCHGADGKGSAAGQKLGVKDFAAPEVAKESDAELFDITKKGKGKMPPSAGKLTDDQIKALVKFIRSLK
ncbi:MAG TPA: c-type cytochrome [Candidatus Angelobacter sp.]|nr:c-type cytochrome [Candidatus Angelobacter sp.]